MPKITLLVRLEMATAAILDLLSDLVSVTNEHMFVKFRTQIDIGPRSQIRRARG